MNSTDKISDLSGSIDLINDFEFSSIVFKKYFKYEARMNWRFGPIYFVLALAAIAGAIGIATGTNIWAYMCCVMIFIALIWAGIPFVIYRSRTRRYLKELDKSIETNDPVFTFSFDQNSISYLSEYTEYKIKWNAIKKYEENEGDLYLFKENRELLDIISRKKIGQALYSKFRALLIMKVSTEI